MGLVGRRPRFHTMDDSTSLRSDFHRFFVAVLVSKAGTRIGAVAMPLVAVVSLDATPRDVGLLTAAGSVAFVLVGLPAGAWLDRVRRRGIMIAADLLRAAFLLSVPAAWWSGRLTMAHLWIVVLLSGVATVFFDIGAQSHLPHLVGRAGLGRANARLVSVDAVGSFAGPAAAGWLVAGIGAPLAVAVDATTYLWSAAWLARVRGQELRPLATERARLRSDIADGLHLVTRDPILRASTAAGAMTNLALAMTMTMLPIVLVRQLGYSEAQLGMCLALGGVGGATGAIASHVVGRILAEGRALVLAGIALGPAALLVPLVGRAVPLWATSAGWAVVGFKVALDNALLTTFRQQITPDHLLGRVNATVRCVLTGGVSLGGLLAGVMGDVWTPRVALWVASGLLSVVWVPIHRSPLRSLRHLVPCSPPLVTPQTDRRRSASGMPT